jgi:hypothetical protein
LRRAATDLHFAVRLQVSKAKRCVPAAGRFRFRTAFGLIWINKTRAALLSVSTDAQTCLAHTEIEPMREALEPTQAPNCVLSHEGRNSRARLNCVSRSPTTSRACARLAGTQHMGVLTTLPCRRSVQRAQHRAASAGTGSCRQLVSRAHSTRRRALSGANAKCLSAPER